MSAMADRSPQLEDIPELDIEKVSASPFWPERADGTPMPAPRYQRAILALMAWVDRDGKR